MLFYRFLLHNYLIFIAQKMHMDFLFIAGILVFPLLLVLPLVLIFLLGSHPDWQDKIQKKLGDFFKTRNI